MQGDCSFYGSEVDFSTRFWISEFKVFRARFQFFDKGFESPISDFAIGFSELDFCQNRSEIIKIQSKIVKFFFKIAKFAPLGMIEVETDPTTKVIATDLMTIMVVTATKNLGKAVVAEALGKIVSRAC